MNHMLKYLLIMIAGGFFPVASFSQTVDSLNSPAKIYGKITGEKSKPLNGANVVIENSIDGATSDSSGYYEFETSRTGKQRLLFTAVEYKEKSQEINIEEGKPLEINVTLSRSEVVTEEILVTASSFTSGEQTKVTLTPLEIVRIPGADADLYRAITTFPGTNQVDEGSRIAVRGGDATEVLTVLDLATLYHPFIFDDDFNTSSYSTVNPWGLRGINFTSGGFSAKYGNALSAVLDLKSYELPDRTGAFLFFGLANASASGIYLSPNKKFGATFDAGQTFLDPYFKINGTRGAEYSPIPFAGGLGGTLSYMFSKGTYLKFMADYGTDKIGIRNASPSFDGYYNSKTKNYFSNIKFSAPLGSSSVINSGVSYNRYERDISYGVLDNQIRNTYAKFRTDITHPLTHKIDLNVGAEYEYNEDSFSGTLPTYSYNLRPDASSFSVNSKTKTGRLGIYAETQLKISKNLFAIPGFRTDYHSLSKKIGLDPRLSLGYNIAKDNVLRAAVGIYHQYPALQYYAQSQDNELKPQQAVHYILGYELNKMDGILLFRVEAYYKDYKNLVLLDSNNFLYNSGGSGFAKGVDVFLKSKITNKYSAWISYSYTDSKRKYLESNVQTSADFDITHNLTAVASYSINNDLTVGMTYRISTGKPYTPLYPGSYDSSQSVYIPVTGLKNSDRFPTYHRFDVNAQYVFSLFGKFAVAVFVLNNVFNQKNLYGYTYNSDYTKRIEIVSTNQRTVYFALGIGL
jgi:TonB-dependent receptor-like protein/carboxypeptidase-like protein